MSEPIPAKRTKVEVVAEAGRVYLRRVGAAGGFAVFAVSLTRAGNVEAAKAFARRYQLTLVDAE